MFIVSVPDDVYHPFQVANQRLTEEGSDRDVRHFELEDPSYVTYTTIHTCLTNFYATRYFRNEKIIVFL
jgi:hypothetical protein